MLLDLDAILAKLFVQIILEFFKSKGISVLMLTIVITILLKAVVGKVHVVILVGKTIIVTGGSQVAFTINIKLVAPRKKCPNTKIKLTTSVQHRFFDIFLNYPQSVSWAGEYELLDILDVSEDFNSLALVESCGFDQPDVILTVLERKSLLLRATVVYLFEPIHELRDLMIVRVA